MPTPAGAQYILVTLNVVGICVPPSRRHSFSTHLLSRFFSIPSVEHEFARKISHEEITDIFLKFEILIVIGIMTNKYNIII